MMNVEGNDSTPQHPTLQSNLQNVVTQHSPVSGYTVISARNEQVDNPSQTEETENKD